MEDLDKKGDSMTDVIPEASLEDEKKEKAVNRKVIHPPKVMISEKFQRLTKWWLKPSAIFA